MLKLKITQSAITENVGKDGSFTQTVHKKSMLEFPNGEVREIDYRLAKNEKPLNIGIYEGNGEYLLTVNTYGNGLDIKKYTQIEWKPVVSAGIVPSSKAA